MKEEILAFFKNIPGPTSSKKMVAFAVDDYGNVRIHSKASREKMRIGGLDVNRSRFDQYDSLETTEDLQMLFEVLYKVKDAKNKSAIFTPYANMANIDFDKSLHDGRYIYKTVKDTFNDLGSEYDDSFRLWKDGINEGFFVPQYHGREHLNVRLFNELLDKKDPLFMTCLLNQSYSALPVDYYENIHYNETYSFEEISENKTLTLGLTEGLDLFEKQLGYCATIFNAPGAPHHHILNGALKNSGVRFLDTPAIRLEHQGQGKYKREFCFTGKVGKVGLKYLNRNCVFEPTLDNRDWVSFTMNQISMAFILGKPAIISSHRVNFCGHIDVKNRITGLKVLQELLTAITKKWPEVEFKSMDELAKELFD